MILPTRKKVSELSFFSGFKIYVLMVSMLALAFKIIRAIIFSAVRKVKFFTVKEIFLDQRSFPQKRIY